MGVSVETITRALAKVLDANADVLAWVKAELHDSGKTGAYNWSLAEVETIANTLVTKCPPGEEAVWLQTLDTAVRELQVRIEFGHLDGQSVNGLVKLKHQIEQRLKTMRRVATLRGYRVYGSTPVPGA